MVNRWEDGECGWRALFDTQPYLSETLVILRTKHARTASSLQPMSHLPGCAVCLSFGVCNTPRPGSLWGKDVGCSRHAFIIMIVCSWHSYPSFLGYETQWCLRLFLIRKMRREMKGQDTEECSFLFVCVERNSFFFLSQSPHWSLHPHKSKCTFWLNLNLSSPRGMIRKCFGSEVPGGLDRFVCVCVWDNWKDSNKMHLSQNIPSKSQVSMLKCS